jgi:transposase
MRVFVGHDWAESHHDVFIEDEGGLRLAATRLADGIEGVARLHELLADLVEDPEEVIVATETDRGLFVGAMVGAGYRVLAINPMSVARYRERLSTSGAKSDQGDARVLAELARTDGHNHRPVAGDSGLVEAVKVLARTHLSLIWSRQRHINQLRSTLREFYPAALEAFEDLSSSDSLTVLGIAPTPQQGRRLSKTRIASALRRGGRQRRLDERATEIHTALRTEHLQAPAVVANAMGATVTALVAITVELVTQIGRIENELANHFEQHPDAEIIRSLPGLGMILGARVLAEFGDDPNRFDSPKSRKNYAGTSPITRASGKQRIVLARYARNQRLANTTHLWAFATLTASPGARRYYDQRRAGGDTHNKALRALANRLTGILHGCLTTRTPYDEHKAWAHRQTAAA